MSERSYSDKLRDPRWQKVRLKVMERDGFKCRDCGNDKETLHVHHCFYERGDPWKTGEAFLLTLCEKCHFDRDSLETDGRRMLGQMFSKIYVQEGLCENDLREFVISMALGVTGLFNEPEYDPPIVVGASKFDYLNDLRWYLYACDHPEARKAYEEVTGTHPEWRKFNR